jgi:hypothetical protein
MDAAERFAASQRDRWMLPDAARWVRPDAARFLAPGTRTIDAFPALDRKFNPNQPRVPAGNPDGGQWADGGGSERYAVPDYADNLFIQDIVAKARRLQLTGSPADYKRCLDLCHPILERFSPRWSDRNTWDFHKCMNMCLGLNR